MHNLTLSEGQSLSSRPAASRFPTTRYFDAVQAAPPAMVPFIELPLTVPV